MDAINKHRLLENYGAAFTWEVLDKMEFYEQQLLIICGNADAKKARSDSRTAEQYRKMGINPVG